MKFDFDYVLLTFFRKYALIVHYEDKNGINGISLSELFSTTLCVSYPHAVPFWEMKYSILPWPVMPHLCPYFLEQALSIS